MELVAAQRSAETVRVEFRGLATQRCGFAVGPCRNPGVPKTKWQLVQGLARAILSGEY